MERWKRVLEMVFYRSTFNWPSANNLKSPCVFIMLFYEPRIFGLINKHRFPAGASLLWALEGLAMHKDKLKSTIQAWTGFYRSHNAWKCTWLIIQNAAQHFSCEGSHCLTCDPKTCLFCVSTCVKTPRCEWSLTVNEGPRIIFKFHSGTHTETQYCAMEEGEVVVQQMTPWESCKSDLAVPQLPRSLLLNRPQPVDKNRYMSLFWPFPSRDTWATPKVL